MSHPSPYVGLRATSLIFLWVPPAFLPLEEGGGGFGLTSGVLVNRTIGFLGVLHMEVFSQRLEQEFDAQASEHTVD